jgi:hypothetical protein
VRPSFLLAWCTSFFAQVLQRRDSIRPPHGLSWPPTLKVPPSTSSPIQRAKRAAARAALSFSGAKKISVPVSYVTGGARARELMLYASSNPQGRAMNTNLITGCLVSAMRLVFPSKKAPQQHCETGHRQAPLICGPFLFGV